VPQLTERHCDVWQQGEDGGIKGPRIGNPTTGYPVCGSGHEDEILMHAMASQGTSIKWAITGGLYTSKLQPLIETLGIISVSDVHILQIQSHLHQCIWS